MVNLVRYKTQNLYKIKRNFGMFCYFFFGLFFTTITNAADFIDFGTVIVESTTRGSVTLNPQNNTLSCSSSVGDIACDATGQAAMVQLAGESGQLVSAYCPSSANIDITNYGTMNISNIKVRTSSGNNVNCISINDAVLNITLTGVSETDRVYVGGQLNIDNEVTTQSNPPTYFILRLIYQ